jgi:hypothetical protein
VHGDVGDFAQIHNVLGAVVVEFLDGDRTVDGAIERFPSTCCGRL